MKTKVETRDVKQILKVDFGKVSVQLSFEGEPEIMDVRKGLGNAIRATTGDIAMNDFAREIYYSEGAIEVPEEYIPFIRQTISKGYIVPVQEAFEKLLTL